jgi:hypothetical protein
MKSQRRVMRVEARRGFNSKLNTVEVRHCFNPLDLSMRLTQNLKLWKRA